MMSFDLAIIVILYYKGSCHILLQQNIVYLVYNADVAEVGSGA
jgi:hypothetical protein